MAQHSNKTSPVIPASSFIPLQRLALLNILSPFSVAFIYRGLLNARRHFFASIMRKLSVHGRFIAPFFV